MCVCGCSYRFVTTFRPFVMGALLVFKLLLPYFLCGAAFLCVCAHCKASLISQFVLFMVRHACA